MAALDQTFVGLGGKLETSVAPFNPWTDRGNPDDDRYLAQPGVDFMRPWLAIRNGPAFQWPLGLQGYTLTIDPELGIHKYIGDNKVVVDVLHAGEEHFTLSGSFVGDSAPKLIKALRDVVYQVSGEEGKILYLPEIVSNAQRVQVVHAEFSRDIEARGRDANYSIELVRLGFLGEQRTDAIRPKAEGTRKVQVTSKYNNLRKIAQWKLGSSNKWRILYNANEKWFIKKKVSAHKAPTYKLPIGLTIRY